MYDKNLIESINQIGTLRRKPGYYQSLVDLFAEEVSRSFAALASHLAAGPIAASEEGWRVLHKLKGSAASIGAVSVAASCQYLLSQWRSDGASLPATTDAPELVALQSQCQRAIQDLRQF